MASGKTLISAMLAIRNCTSSKTAIRTTRPIGGFRTGHAPKRCCGAPDLRLPHGRRPKFISANALMLPMGQEPSIPGGLSRNDRSGDDLERAQQQVALGLGS